MGIKRIKITLAVQLMSTAEFLDQNDNILVELPYFWVLAA